MGTLKDSVRQIADALAGRYDRSEAEAVARAVVMERAGVSFSHIVARGDEQCTIADIDRITGELAAGRPLQYVLGHCEFCGSDFEVGEGVLIPRPETEELVAAAAGMAVPKPQILDLCTGSGCIAVSLAKMIPGSRVCGVDISPRALDYARRNALKAGVEAEFVEADVLNAFAMFGDGEFDVIVSNPPYVPESDRSRMHINVVGYEPHEALFVSDSDPLVFYRAIADHGQRLLRDGGALCFEIYEHYAGQVCSLLESKGYRDVAALDDANMKPRIVCSRK